VNTVGWEIENGRIIYPNPVECPTDELTRMAEEELARRKVEGKGSELEVAMVLSGRL
jgi:hypothetical protein